MVIRAADGRYVASRPRGKLETGSWRERPAARMLPGVMLKKTRNLLCAAVGASIGMSIAFGFNLGLAFSIGMVLLAAGYILYQTSQVLEYYDPQQYVAASLALFSSVALMFWYVIRIFLRARS